MCVGIMYTERYLTCINGNLLKTVNFILVVYIDLVHILNLLKLIFGRLLCESHNNSYCPHCLWHRI